MDTASPIQIRHALHHGRATLPPLSARLLLQHLLNVPHTHLITHDNDTLTADQWQTYQTWVHRAAQHEPIPYIIGQAPFHGRTFHVSPAVLIPRPETEQLVQLGRAWANANHPHTILDIGTGTGCIPLTLAATSPHAHIFGADISAPALAIAQKNGRLHAPRVQFIQSNLLSAFTLHHGRGTLLTANLPYITDHEWTHLPIGVKSYEPPLALRGGGDGLTLIHQLLRQATHKLAPPFLILLEIGWQQGQPALKLAQHHFPTAETQLLTDYAHRDRLISIQQKK